MSVIPLSVGEELAGALEPFAAEGPWAAEMGMADGDALRVDMEIKARHLHAAFQVLAHFNTIKGEEQ